jgi:putative membrane protein
MLKGDFFFDYPVLRAMRPVRRFNRIGSSLAARTFTQEIHHMSTLTAPPGFRTPLQVVVGLIGLSALASIFLVWLVYSHQPTDAAGVHLAFLPALNAVLNSLCTVALLVGFRYIRRGAVVEHRNSMLAAFFFSSLFLVSYITNHFMHGDNLFRGHGPVRPFYFVLLISHIVLSVVALPMILITFFFSLTRRFTMHRKIARFTFPVWLYVSVTGVVVYAMLAAYR